MADNEKALVDALAIIHQNNPDIARGILIGARMTADALKQSKKEES